MFHPYMWVLLIVALVLCSVGFYRFVWFMSVGYGLAIGGLGVAILVFAFLNGQASIPVILACVLMIIYGARLSMYLLFRELKNASYRKTLNQAMKEAGCNKVAYAHHKDDVVETMMMSLIYEGRFHTFHPKTYMSRSGITVIRPLVYLPESHVKHMQKILDLPVVTSPCPADKHTMREDMKELMNRLKKIYPDAPERFLHALQQDHYDLRNIIPTDESLSVDDALASAQMDAMSYASIVQPLQADMGLYWTPAQNMGEELVAKTVTHENAAEKTEAMNLAMNTATVE